MPDPLPDPLLDPPGEADVLRYIAGYQRAHAGVSPSQRECAAALNCGLAHIHRCIAALERRAAIRRLRQKSRAIDVLDVPAIPMLAGQPLFAVRLAPRA